MFCTNFFSWKTQVGLALQQDRVEIELTDPALVKDMEFAYFHRHLSVDDYVNEIRKRLRDR
ncbi:hypothetical protein K0504_15300 [Neiella marina]|uniref:Uncharacterized protein n=1 Tax=Neiella holothuriorum TaxID=2870530 RepID=A0ABS7EJ71_9GAMM|nr:hypothetical protein [Neiella holothuriorum]MBW8192403.1 hypothetical protein [Neiella holothuriorum]